jgi:hypothetical protein
MLLMIFNFSSIFMGILLAFDRFDFRFFEANLFAAVLWMVER